jgi:glutaredoxin
MIETKTTEKTQIYCNYCKRQPETVFSSSCGFRVRLTNVGSDAPQLKKFDRACVKLRVPFGPPRT